MTPKKVSGVEVALMLELLHAHVKAKKNGRPAYGMPLTKMLID